MSIRNSSDGNFSLVKTRKLQLNGASPTPIELKSGGTSLFSVNNSGTVTCVGINSGSMSLSGATVTDQLIVDSTNSAAFKVRRDSAGGDVFVIDTSGNTGTFNGDFTINGVITSVEAKSITTEDVLIHMAQNNGLITDTYDQGLFGEYKNSGVKYWSLYRDSSDSGIFKLQKEISTLPTTVVPNGTDATLQLGSLKIGSNTLSDLQYLTPINQNLTTSSNVTFGNITGTLSSASQPNIATLAGLTSIQGQSIATTAWQYVNTMNQNLATTSSPSFVNVTSNLTGNVTGNVTGSSSLNVLKAGDTMSGALNMGAQNISNVNTITSTTGNITNLTAVTTTSMLGNSISSAQWGYLAALDQNLTTNSNVMFLGATIEDIYVGSLHGSVVTGSQPYITSLGNLTGLNVYGSTVLSNASVSAPTVSSRVLISDATGGSSKITLAGNSFSGNTSTDGISFALNHNASNNRQLFIGDSALMASSATNCGLRIIPGNGGSASIIDSVATNSSSILPLQIGNTSNTLALKGSAITATGTFKCSSVMSANDLTPDSNFGFMTNTKIASGAGTAGGPSYSFFADNTIGMYYTSNNLNFSVGGSRRLQIDNSGNVFHNTDGAYIQTNGTASVGMVPHWYLGNSGTNKWGIGLVNSANDYGLFCYRTSDSAYTNVLSCSRTTGSHNVNLHQALKLDVYTDNTNGNVTAGTFTPTYTNVAGLSSITHVSCVYQRIGNVIQCSGSFTATGNGSPTFSLTITTPVSGTVGTMTGTTNVYGITATGYCTKLEKSSNTILITLNTGANLGGVALTFFYSCMYTI